MHRLLCALVAVTALASTPAALAHGDPASDALVQEDVFFPYDPPTNEPFRTALVDLLKEARSIGFPVKVALIQSAGDLGAFPQMFNDPQTYADLLYNKLPVEQKAQPGVASEQLRLLVIMPAGFGGQNLGAGVDRALAPVKINTEEASDGLARAALRGIPRLARQAGFPLKTPAAAGAPAVAGGQDDGPGPPPLVFIAPLLLVLVGAGLAGRMARKHSTDEPGDPLPKPPGNVRPDPAQRQP